MKGSEFMTKKYYWIKLKTDFFDLETIDWLISQKNGCEYVVLYQKLCLLTANKDGELVSAIGEIIIPYDANKIARDTKFPIDTVIVALELFKKIGLIYEQENGILKIPYIADIVGSETEYAKKKRDYRDKLKTMSETMSLTLSDKSIDIEKEKEKEKDIDTETNTDISLSGKPDGACVSAPVSQKKKKKSKAPEYPEAYGKIISYLNQKAGTKYQASSKFNQKFINARLGENYTVQDFMTVIDKKCNEWLGTDNEKYIRPETLFGNKFESYLNQTVQPHKTGQNGIEIEQTSENDTIYDIFNLEFGG